jgi:hypothetical protein
MVAARSIAAASVRMVASSSASHSAAVDQTRDRF